MVVRQRIHVEDRGESGPNWLLIALVGLSIELWIVIWIVVRTLAPL